MASRRLPWRRRGACLGVCFSIACAVAGGLAPGGIGPWLLTLAAMLPALLVQDVWRAAFFARSKPQGAFVNDLVWFAVLAAGVGLVESGVLTGGRAALGAWERRAASRPSSAPGRHTRFPPFDPRSGGGGGSDRSEAGS